MVTETMWDTTSDRIQQKAWQFAAYSSVDAALQSVGIDCSLRVMSRLRIICVLLYAEPEKGMESIIAL